MKKIFKNLFRKAILFPSYVLLNIKFYQTRINVYSHEIRDRSLKIAFLDPSIGTENVGDYFITDSIKLLIDGQFFDFQLKKNNIFENKKIYELINRCDVCIIGGTNLYRNTIINKQHFNLNRSAILKIKIPIIPLGLGIGGNTPIINPDNESKKIVRLMHKKCIYSSVRDDYGIEYLRMCGVNNAIMTGCPTLYRSLSEKIHIYEENRFKKRVLLTITRHKDSPSEYFLDYFIKKYDPLILCQMEPDYKYIMEKWPHKKENFIYSSDFRKTATKYYDLLNDVSMVVGTRLHGNMVALSYGIPSYYLCVDPRLVGFCETFSLPYIHASDSEAVSKIESLINSEGFFKPFEEKYTLYFKEMRKFLDYNGLPNNLA